MTAPDPTGAGAARAMWQALADASAQPDDIDFINAHGTGTDLNDRAEFAALKLVFAERTGEIPITSTKASVGHFLGSAGAIEAVVTVRCLQKQQIHPTPGPGELDPETPVRLVRRLESGRTELRQALSLSLAFGGCNGALVLSRWQEGGS